MKSYIFEGSNLESEFAGAVGHDTILGYDGDDTLFGNAGNDYINGNRGNDVVDGGSGSDFVRGGQGHDLVNGNDGDDWHVNGNIGNDTVNGGLGDDVVHGGQGQDIVDGDDGNDTVYGDQGNDICFGDDGDDLIYGGDGDDSLNGGYGHDTILGGIGDDIITGGLGNDFLLGGDGNDIIYVGAEKNIPLMFQAQQDIINGGNGIDILVLIKPLSSYSIARISNNYYEILDNQVSAKSLVVNVERVQFSDGSVYEFNELVKPELLKKIPNGDGTFTYIYGDYKQVDNPVKFSEAPIVPSDGRNFLPVDGRGDASKGYVQPVDQAGTAVVWGEVRSVTARLPVPKTGGDGDAGGGDGDGGAGDGGAGDGGSGDGGSAGGSDGGASGNGDSGLDMFPPAPGTEPPPVFVANIDQRLPPVPEPEPLPPVASPPTYRLLELDDVPAPPTFDPPAPLPSPFPLYPASIIPSEQWWWV